MNGVFNVGPYVALSAMRHPKRDMKDVTNHKKKETIMPLSWDETDILLASSPVPHKFYFHYEVDAEDVLLGYSVTHCLSTMSRCDRQGGLMYITIHQHCSSSNNLIFLKQS